MKQSEAKIKQLAEEAAAKILAVATETAKNLAAETSLKISYIQRDISEIKTMLDNRYVTKMEFEPVHQFAIKGEGRIRELEDIATERKGGFALYALTGSIVTLIAVILTALAALHIL